MATVKKMMLPNIILLILLTIAAITDIMYRKIPNALTLPAVIIGLVYHAYLTGVDGFLFSTGGVFLGIGSLFLFYLLGMMGAGDVKLMGAVGSILGPAGVFQAFLFTAIAGGVYAIIALAVNGQLMQFLKRFVFSLKLSFLTRKLTLLPNENKSSPILCYGIAIGAGTVISLFIQVPI